MYKRHKNFTGSKEQEKAKVEELNRKYGESFGYYQTLSGWYDTLIQKSEDYVQVLLHQANVQNLVNKAAEADEEVNKIKAQNPDEVEGAHGGFFRFMAKMGAHHVGLTPQEMDAEVDKENETNKAAKIKEAEARREAYLTKAKEEAKKAAEAAGKGNIGGHTDPEQSGKNAEAEAKQRLATERRLAPVSYTHLRAHETGRNLVCRLLLEKKKKNRTKKRKQRERDEKKKSKNR